MDPRGVGNLSGGCRCPEPLTGQSDLGQETEARDCHASFSYHPGSKELLRVKADPSSLRELMSWGRRATEKPCMQPRVTEAGAVFQVLFSVL